MNWNKPSLCQIEQLETPTKKSPLLEQVNWGVDISFHIWSSEDAIPPPKYYGQTVALWMPKGLKKRNNGK